MRFFHSPKKNQCLFRLAIPIAIALTFFCQQAKAEATSIECSNNGDSIITIGAPIAPQLFSCHGLQITEVAAPALGTNSVVNNGVIYATGSGGTASGGAVVIAIPNKATFTFTNNGTITSANTDVGPTGTAFSNHYNVDNNIGSIFNNNLIDGGNYIGIDNSELNLIGNIINSTNAIIRGDIGINNLGTISSIENSGSILGSYAGINNFETISYIENSGSIVSSNTGINNYGIITTLTNGTISNTSAMIEGANNNGIELFYTGSIGTLNNYAAINGLGNAGIYLGSATTINILNNYGSITGNLSGPDKVDIYNGLGGNINFLNNAQGGDGLSRATTALTFTGKSPTNYNIIILSPTHYGQLNLSEAYSDETITFGIDAGSTVVNNTKYANVFKGLVGTLSGSSIIGPESVFTITGAKDSYGGYSYALAQNGSPELGNWDLIFGSLGPTAADTQASLSTQARRLRSTFNSTMASSNFANMNTYDCNLFDKNNMCISAGGRYTSIDNPSSNNSAAVVVLGYKVSPNIRIGGFLDQSVNHNMPSGVDMSNKNPMMGAFAVWNHQADGLGFQMKLANAYLDKDVTTSRAIIGTSEAGRGRTDLNTQSYVGELSYAFQYQDSTIVRPYFAVRYTNIKQDGYTEDTTASVTAPLTYAKLSDRSTTALTGVKLNHALTPRTNLTASLGVEQDINHQVDKLTATGVADLTSENFNNNIKRTRPVASAGAYYAVAKNQRLSGELYYQQLPFQSTGSATAYFNYMIGF